MSEQDTKTASAAPAEAPATGSARKVRVGEVISDKMQKTIVVKTTRRVPHPKFGKIVKRSKKFYAHDEEGKARVGDIVSIRETRPLSKLKRWELIEVIKH